MIVTLVQAAVHSRSPDEIAGSESRVSREEWSSNRREAFARSANLVAPQLLTEKMIRGGRMLGLPD